MTPTPFPHAVFNDWFDLRLLQAAANEFPPLSQPGWRRFANEHESKWWWPNPAGRSSRDYFAELAGRAGELADLFDLPDLTMEMIGGGYHLIPPAGYLDVHSDFSRSPDTGRYRRLNVLTFLNHDWKDDDGGFLELWDAAGPVVRIAPEFGTTVAFVTSATSWHGHPKPTKRWRASLAAYFFTVEPPEGFEEQSTVWHPAGGGR